MNWRVLLPVLLLLAGNVVLRAAEKPAAPLQLFLVELLDQERGNWEFRQVMGADLEHPGEVAVFSRLPREEAGAVVLRLDDPEFPGDAGKAEFREFSAGKEGRFALRAGGFAADLTPAPAENGSRWMLTKIRLGGAMKADRIPAALYLSDGKRLVPLRLAGRSGGVKLLSDRFGSVFVGDEPVRLHAVRLEEAPAEAEYVVTDSFRNREMRRGRVRLSGGDTAFTIPLERYGSFSVELRLPGRTASLRVTRIPEPRQVEPEKSFMGMNIFQQQLRYYSCQLPLFAQAGIRWIRPWLHWENTWKVQEPEEGTFDTRQLDALRRRLALHNQKYTYILYNFSPVLELPSTEFSPLDAAQMRRWCDYVKRIAAHCPEVDDWEVWNEPDLMTKRDPAFSSGFYRELFLKTAETVRSVRPEARLHAISHASVLPWLEELCCDARVADAADVVTLHTYAAPSAFVPYEAARQRVLDYGGFCGKPQQFNEIGASGYDGCPAYSAAFPGTSERRQAEVLPVNWAQSLHFAGPQGKAYWFCSLDPRDSTDPVQRTGDSGYGLLYLGGQPKIAYAVLAATAKLLDGSECLGRMEIPGAPVRYVAFSGGRAVVWSDSREGEIGAVELGCDPGEELEVCDLFGNPVGRGRAAELKLTLDDGPRFLLGSKRLGDLAGRARKLWMQRRQEAAAAERRVGKPSLPELKTGEEQTFEFAVPGEARVEWTVSRGFPGKLQVRREKGMVRGKVIAGERSGSGWILFSVALSGDGKELVRRQLPVSVARRDFISDGNFIRGNIDGFRMIANVRYDGTAGSDMPGCLRFDGPFSGRLELPVLQPLLPGRALHFRAKIKGRLSDDVKLSFNVAMFNERGWSGTWMAAALRDGAREGEKLRPFTAKIPELPVKWSPLAAALPESKLPPGENSMVFFIDCYGGTAGDFLLIDELELWQETEVEGESAALAWGRWLVERDRGVSMTEGGLELRPPLSARLHVPVELSCRRFRFKVRSALDGEARIKVALANFGGGKWLGDRVLAATQGAAAALIPRSSGDWAELSGEIPALPPGTQKLLLFVDGAGGIAGSRCEISPIELFE